MYIALTLDHLDSLEQRALWPGFGSLVLRAMGFLHDRTPAQIRYALEAVNFILESPENNSATDTPLASDSPFIAVRLHRYAVHYDIGKIPEFPEASWTELFAVLALGLLEEAARSFRGWPTTAPPSWYPTPVIENDPSIQALVDPVDAYSFACFLAAVEALAFAQAEVRLPQAVKKQISLNNQRANIARHAASRAIEEDFWRYYQNGTFRSVRAAAKQYCDEHPEIFEILKPTNAERTLTDFFSHRARERGVKSR